MNICNELYTLPSQTPQKEIHKEIEENLMIVVSMLEALKDANKLNGDLTNHYIKAINNLTKQAFQIYDYLYKINADEAEIYRQQRSIFLLNKKLSKEQLHDYFNGIIYQLSSLIKHAIDEGLLDKINTTCGNILIAISIHVHQLIQLVENLSLHEFCQHELC